MDMDLPDPIARYFAADRASEPARVGQCFTEDATVRDEGAIHRGRTAISDWKTGSSQKYRYTVEPLSVAQDADRIIVTSRLEGDFPGSPVDLHYAFTLEGGQIAALEIRP